MSREQASVRGRQRAVGRRRGFNLVEVVVAAAVLAVLGLPVLTVLSTGNRETMMSEDYIQAEMLATRFLEEKLSLEYDQLDELVPRTENSRAVIDGAAPTRSAIQLFTEQIDAGEGYRISLQMRRLEPDLLSLDVTVSWTLQGKERKYALLRMRGRENLSAGGRPVSR